MGVICNAHLALSRAWGGATNLHATLDGQDLLTFPSFRQTSTAFFVVDFEASLSDALGFPPQYVGTLDIVSDGFWVALTGLTPGQHTLVFGGTVPELAPGADPFTLEVTDTITVVPEPGTLSLMLLGTLAFLGRRRGAPHWQQA